MSAPQPTMWRDEPAVRVGTKALTAVVAPARSAKIVSLRAGEREWLAAPADPLPAPARPGDRFTEAEMCGWDEMVPTIDSCPVPNGFAASDGAALPGHGEAWTARWRVTRDGPAVVAEATGTLLPWRLSRRIAPAGDDLVFDYELAALGEVPVPLMWTAHPQFTVRADTRLRLPGTVSEVHEVYGARVGTRSPWRETLGTTGLASGEGRKVYADPGTPVGAASLIDSDGSALHLSWDATVVPYLGLWWDNTAFSRVPVVALEPSTGYYDSLTRAVASGTAGPVHPHRPWRWRLRLRAEPPRCP